MGMKEQDLALGFKVQLGEQCHGTLYGGPFYKYVQGTRRMVGIKMAEEIDHPHEYAVDTEDFNVPTQEAMQKGIEAALREFHAGNDVYVGCMGGIGRTGLFMGCMAKVMGRLDELAFGVIPEDPVKFVRANFKPHAIETDEQKAFVRDFDPAPALAVLDSFEPVAEKIEVPVEKIVTKEVVKEVEVIKHVYLSPLQWFNHVVFGMKPQ
jgi:hypothetical protein